MITNRMLRDALDGPGTRLAYARLETALVGYCAAVQLFVDDYGPVMWVSQLVVDSNYREHRVGTQLLYGVWQFSNLSAWGLATSNPLAVRALETATRRPCRSAMIRRFAPTILPTLQRYVKYMPPQLVEADGRVQPRVNTQFYVDLQGMKSLRKKARRNERRWTLGQISPGEEWFACTFRSQQPGSLSKERLETLLRGSDAVWIGAYERMTLNGTHKWRRYTELEVDFALRAAELPPDARVLDIGCGDGRHTERLASSGYKVVGVDIAPRLIERAKARLPTSVDLRIADAREDDLGGPYQLVLCVYDVIGSSAQRIHDLRLLRNIRKVIGPGGMLILTVMNANVTMDTVSTGHKPDSVDAFVRSLESLDPSSTMEASGNIFDPDRIVIYNGVHYRKEQFEKVPGYLPTECVVRDLRYTVAELVDLMREAGMGNPDVRPVIIGHWSDPDVPDEHDLAAKELLAIWRSPADA